MTSKWEVQRGPGHPTKWWPALYICRWSGGEFGGIGLRLGKRKRWTILRTPAELKRLSSLVDDLNVMYPTGTYISTEEDSLNPCGVETEPPVPGSPFGGAGFVQRFYEEDGKAWVLVDYGYAWVILPTTRIEIIEPPFGEVYMPSSGFLDG